MFLNFIGTGGAFNTKLGNNSAYQIFGKHLFLIDCGGTVFDRLIQAGILDNVENVTVLITHFHPDHIGSLGDLIFYCYFNKNLNSAKVISPNMDNLRDLLASMGISEQYYDWAISHVETNTNIVIGNVELSIYPILTKHDKYLRCYGYYIENTRNYSTCYYSGDASIIPIGVLEDLKEGYIDILYQDTTSLDYEGNIHLSLRELEELIPQELRQMVVCMHLDKEFNTFKAKQLGFQVANSVLEFFL